MNDEPYSGIAEYFDAKVDTHGHSRESCGWGSEESQIKRFQVLCDVMPLHGKSILDIGCGPGYFADFLDANDIRARYTGYDISTAMVEVACKRRPELDIRYGNVLTVFPRPCADVVIASGALFLLGEEPQKWFECLVRGFFECAEKALAFNCLSAWGNSFEQGEFYPDPLAALEFCRTLSPWVALRHDYHPQDFTIYLYKQKN